MDRPILFSAQMVRAILAGSKTQTRRVLKPAPGQKWLTPKTISEVRRFEHLQDGCWSLQVGAPNRIVHAGHEMDGGHIGSVRCPYGKPGDRLWVRETWNTAHQAGLVRHTTCWGPAICAACRAFVYFADHEAGTGRWKPSIHMPRAASRLTLDVLSVRVERLQEITEADARAEGVEPCGGFMASSGCWTNYGAEGPSFATARDSFASLWRSINGPDSWDANPWVWVLGFNRVEVAR